MEEKKRYSIKNILLGILWIGISAGAVVLLVAAMRKKDAERCKDVQVEIKGVSNNFFVDKADVMAVITAIAKGAPKGRSIGSFDLKAMEAELEKSTWIRAAELFFDNNDILRVTIIEREPIARVFTLAGNTFYIDSAVAVLPVNDKFSARLPVFTSFPAEEKHMTAADTLLLHGIKAISLAIEKDSFRMAMIDQVDITAQRSFEMIPKLGNQVIVFGDAADADNKFDKLALFYKEVMPKAGWSKYSVINLQYKNQVVAKIRGAEDKTSDSLRTLQTMQLIADNAERLSADSLKNMLPDNDRGGTDTSMVQESIQRDEESEGATIEDKPVVNTPAVIKPAADKPVPVKPVPVKPATPKPATPKPVVVKPAVGNAKPPDKKPVVVKPADKPKPKPVTKPAAQKPRVNNDY